MKSLFFIPNIYFLQECILIFLLVIQCEGSNPNNMSRIPEIEVKWQVLGSSGWYLEGHDVHHGVTFQNNDQDIILTSSVNSFILICSAHYPVHWTFDFPVKKMERTVPVIYLHRTSEDFKDPRTYKFYSYLTFPSYVMPITTGDYTCKSTNTSDEDLQTTRFIFSEGATKTMVYGERAELVYATTTAEPIRPYEWIYAPSDRTHTKRGFDYTQPKSVSLCRTPSCKGIPSITVRGDKDNQTIILPCAVNSPTTTLKLYKRSESETAGGVEGNKTLEYKEIQWKNTTGITFDPKVGFILYMQEQAVPPYGIYKCTPSMVNYDEVLIINVTTGVELACKGENNTLFGHAKYSFNTDDKYGSRIMCCSNGTKPPRIYKSVCSTKYDCDLIRKELQEFQYFDSNDIRSGNCRSSLVSSNYKVTNKSAIGVFRCFGDGIDVTREFYIPVTTLNGENGNQSAIYYDGEIYDALLNNSDLITFSSDKNSQVDQNVLFACTNASVTLECHTSNYLLALGVRWSIVWQNKTTQFIPEKGGYVISDKIGAEPWNELNVKASKDIHSIICHAPVHNSSGWVNRTLYFNATDGRAPMIDGSPYETLIWVFGDTNKTLTCQATGFPIPSYIWREPIRRIRYDDEYLRTHSNWREWLEYDVNKDTVSGEWNSTLTFKRVLHIMGGNYTCIAYNSQAGGYEATVSKTFMVIVRNETEEVATSSSSKTETSTSTPVHKIENKKENGTGTSLNTAVPNQSLSDSDNHVHSKGLGIGTVILLCLSVGISGLLIGGGLVWKKRKSDDSGTSSEVERSDTVSYQDLTGLH